MIQIWQVPSECSPSNLVVLGLVNKRSFLIIRQGDKNIEWVETSYLVNSHHFNCVKYCRITSCRLSMFELQKSSPLLKLHVLSNMVFASEIDFQQLPATT